MQLCFRFPAKDVYEDMDIHVFCIVFYGIYMLVCKGEGIIAILISAVILGVLFAQAFCITQGFYVFHFMEVITWIIGVIIMCRKPKEFVAELGLSVIIAFLYQLVILILGRGNLRRHCIRRTGVFYVIGNTVLR